MIEANGETNNVALTPEGVLDELRRRGGYVETQILPFSRELGWPRMALKRQLDRWETDGILSLSTRGNGGSQITVITLASHVQSKKPRVQWLRHLWSKVPSNLTGLMALVATILAIAALVTSMRITAEYGETLGHNEKSIENFAMLSMICEATAFFSPSFFECLMDVGRKRLAWMAAGIPFVIATAWTLQAAFGYASINVSDVKAVRSDATEVRSGVEGELKKAREAKADRQKQMTRTEGQQRVKETDIANLDKDIATLQDKLKAMPAKVSVDPQAEAANKIFGMSVDSFVNFRTISITVLPQLSGFLLACAIGLWRGKGGDE